METAVSAELYKERINTDEAAAKDNNYKQDAHELYQGHFNIVTLLSCLRALV
jgi:hypothetical protein